MTTDSQTRSRHPRTRGALYNFLSNPLYIGKVRHKGRIYDGQHAPIVDRELWDSVQAQLGHNRQQRERQSNARHPSLLAGLIFDDRGHAMSPSHANKGTRRYRYYTSQALLLYKDDQAGSVVRVPARDVETAVVNELKCRLDAPLRLLETQDTTGWPVVKIDQFVRSGQKLAREWDEQSVSDQIDCLRCLIRRVVVSRESIEITFAAEGWVSVLLPNETSVSGRDLSDVTTTLPVKLRRSAHESRLVIKDAEVQQTPAAWREALQSAIAKAMYWNAELINGEVTSVRAIAERENVSERYVARILRLAWLAPDIVRKVAQGEVPDTLTLRRLQQGYPLDWAQQQSALLAQ